MRDFKGMKRQRGRNRAGGGAQGGGGKPQQNVNRAFDSNGPDNVKIRGHAQHVFEKYQQLARDAFSSGDRVLAENYLQHADHYFRVLRTIQPNRAPAEILGRDVFASGLDIDFEDEGETFEETTEAGAGEAEQTGEAQRADNGRGEQRYDNNRFEGRGDNNRQDYRQDRQDNGRQDRRDERSDRSDRFEGRQESRREGENGRYEGRRESQDNREGRNAGRYGEGREGRDTPPRADRDDSFREPRADNRRDYAEAREARRDHELRDQEGGFEESGQPEGRSRRQRGPREGRYGVRPEAPVADAAVSADPMAVIEREAVPLPFTPAAKAESEAVLRSHDGEVSEAPAFLQASAADDGEVRKPRVRRRRPKALEGAEGGETIASVSEDA